MDIRLEGLGDLRNSDIVAKKISSFLRQNVCSKLRNAGIETKGGGGGGGEGV